MEGSTATITAVAVGGAVVTVTASDGSASASQGFNVSVSDPSGKPATVAIFGLRSVTDRNTAVDPTNVSGDVTVLLDVQPNDETIAGIALTLGDETIHCRGTSSGRDGFIAAASGELEVECLFKTASVMGECVGAQLAPLFANGDHTLGARVTTADGETREAIVTQPVTLNNSGFVMVVHSAGSASAVVAGVTYHGGPVDEDDDSNQNSFHACPVSYDGTTVGELSLTTKLTGPGATELEVGEDETAPPTLAITKQMDAFTWNVVPASNGGVENRPGKDEHWVINSGDIKDDGGLLVTSKFRGDAEVMIGPLYFDFKAPTWTHDPDEGEPVEILRSTRSGPVSVAGKTFYNSGNFSVRGLTDGGVGGAAASFAAGDCSTVANSDSLKSTAFVPAAGLEDVSGFGDLPEDDYVNDFTDAGGLNCYVAEVTAAYDGLGNEATLPGTPIGTRGYFGVDKTRPSVSDVTPSGAGMILTPAATLSFEAEDPDLATGEKGAGLWGTNWFIPGRTGPLYRAPTSPFGTIGSHLARDGTYSVRAQVWDDAEPGNGGQITYSFTRDGTEPTFTVSKSQSNIGNTQATRVNVSVGGTISDANGIEAAELSVRSPADGVCPTGAADELNLPARRVSGNKRDLSSNGSTTITFDETFTVSAPSAGDISGAGSFVEEALCFYLYTEDVATDEDGDGPGNYEMYDVGSFSVSWLNPGPVHRIGAANWDPDAQDATPMQGAAITADAPLKATEGAVAGAQFVVTLSSPADGDLTVSLSAPTTVTLDPASVTIADGMMVSDASTVTAGHDRNTASEEVEITATVSGGTNYDGSSGKIAALTVDDDLDLVVTPRSVTEQTALAAEGTATLVEVRVYWPTGATRPDFIQDPVTVPLGQTGQDDYTFYPIRVDGGIVPFDPADPGTEAANVSLRPSSLNLQRGYWYAWLVAEDDTDDEEPETIQIGADATEEAGRMEPAMITIMDSDPEVTLSIEDVDEGAEDMTVTVTATAAGPMPGIFEIAAGDWEALSQEMMEAGYAFTASGTLTIDRNQTEGTVSVTVTAPEDDDKDDGMFMVSLTDPAVALSGAAPGQGEVTVGMLTVKVVDNDKDDG